GTCLTRAAPGCGGSRHLDCDQLHVGHGDKVTEIGGVVERVPVAYLDGGDADRHGVLFMDARSLRQCAPYSVNLRQPWKGGPNIAGPAASVDRAAFDTHGDTSWTEIPQRSSPLPDQGVLLLSVESTGDIGQ